MAARPMAAEVVADEGCEPWLEHVRASRAGERAAAAPARASGRGGRPTSAHHVAQPKVAAAAQRPASARPASARPASARSPNQPRQVVGGTFLRAQRWAQETQQRQQRGQSPRRRPLSSAAPATAARRKADVGPSAYSVRESPRAKCHVVAGRQTLTPRVAVERPASARPGGSAAPQKQSAGTGKAAAAVAAEKENDAMSRPISAGSSTLRVVVKRPASARPTSVQPGSSRVAEQARPDAEPAARAAAVIPEGKPRAAPSKDPANDLRQLLGIPDGVWAFAANETAAFNGGAAISGSGQRRLLMPTWARLAERVELMQRQNREAAGFLSGLASTTAVEVPQHPVRTTESISGSSALPDWPDAGPMSAINPRKIATGWRGLPEDSSRRRASGLGEDRAAKPARPPSAAVYGRSGRVVMSPEAKEVTVNMEPGQDWARLLW